MANNIVGINTDALDVDLETLTEAYGDVVDQIKIVHDLMYELNQMWEGAANAVFNDQFQKDNETLQEVCDYLEKYLECCENAKKSYVENENNVYDLIKNLSMKFDFSLLA